MEELRFLKNYKDDTALRLSFNKLAMETFGQALNFETWYEDGYWNDCYTCYSMIDGDHVVSNISVNNMTVVIAGQEKRALQIGTVMTHPDYRKQGLATKLMEEVMKDYQEAVDFIYLFGNDDAKNLYLSWGFEAIEEKKYTLDATLLNKKEGIIRKLDISRQDDLSFLIERAACRQSVSNKFGVTNDEHLVMFYCSKFMGETLYYIEDQDAILSYEIEDGVLHLYEVIGQSVINLRSLLEQIVNEEVTRVEFYFTPDIDESLLKVDELIVDDQTLLVLPKQGWSEENFRFPFFSHA